MLSRLVFQELFLCICRGQIVQYIVALLCSLAGRGGLITCEGDGDVVGVVTPLGGAAQAFHGDQVVELRVQLALQEVEGKEEDK